MNINSILGEKPSFHVSDIYTLHGTDKIFAKVCFNVPMLNATYEEIISLSDAKNQTFKAQIPEGFFLGDASPKKIQKEIYKSIILKLSSEKPKTLLPQGFSKISDKWVYVFGNRIINDTLGEYAPYNPRKLTTNHTDNSLYMSSCEWCKIYCMSGVQQSALFLCALTPYLKPITETLNFQSKVAHAFAVGASGTGKTSYCKLITELCDGNPSGVNLVSDQHEILSELSYHADRSFLLDDLNSSSSNREVERKKVSLSEVLQLASGGGIAQRKKTFVDIERTALVITGEFVPDATSTKNRCVLIQFDENSFNADSLSKLQREMHLYGIFIECFLEWVCNNADMLTEWVNAQLQKGAFDYSGKNSGATSYDGYMRIINSYKILKITQVILLGFMNDQNMLPQQTIKAMNSQLNKAISKAIADTLESVKVNHNFSDILSVVLDVFRDDSNKIVAPDWKEYFHTNNNYIFFRYGNCYYFRGENLSHYISFMLDRDISTKAISGKLMSAGLLVMRGGEKSYSLPKSFKGKKKNRYYRLNVTRLSDYLTGMYSFLELVDSPIEELRPEGFRN